MTFQTGESQLTEFSNPVFTLQSLSNGLSEAWSRICNEYLCSLTLVLNLS